jgi:hypothetical protein
VNMMEEPRHRRSVVCRGSRLPQQTPRRCWGPDLDRS